MTTLSLAPAVLQWAAGNIGSTVEQLAARIAAESRVEKVASGVMTPKQAEKFATLARVPFGFLFLAEPPKIKRPDLPDLRQVQQSAPLSESFYDTLRDIQKKQEWYAEHLKEIEADAPDFVGKFNHEVVDVKKAAREIAAAIGCNAGLRERCSTKEDYFSQLVRGVEASGVLVFKNGVVHNNGHRPLRVSEFHGFALVHPVAPAVFINGKDAAAAWVFTLIHEVAHVWFGQSGVSDFSASSDFNPHGLEQKCNEVAAEVLVPKDEFIRAWGQYASAIPLVARQFKVSSLVIARRALDLGFIERYHYQVVLAQTHKAATDESGGGDFYKSVVVRNSRKFTSTVVNEAFSGRMLLRTAGSLLNVSPNAVAELRIRRGA